MYWNQSTANKHFPTCAWLIETWDVLKLLGGDFMAFRVTVINRNMRCIEIINELVDSTKDVVINRNMRCIEIHPLLFLPFLPSLINRNMRCIEITGGGFYGV